LSKQPPWNAISDVTATDPEHFEVRWKEHYPGAANLSEAGFEFPALPMHILGTAFDQIASTPESFANNAFWTQQYVGLGPFRLVDWQPGASIDAERFTAYALGTPKIDRI